MGHASELLFTPLASKQNSKTEMSNERYQKARNDITTLDMENQNPGPSSPEDGSIQCAANPSNTSSSGPAGDSVAEGIAEDGFLGFSNFRGLGQLLHNVLVLGAIDAKEKFQDTSTQTGGDDGDLDARSEASDDTFPAGDETAIEGSGSKIAMELDGDSIISPPIDATEAAREAAYKVVSGGHFGGDENALDHEAQLTCDTRKDTKSELEADGTTTEEMPANLEKASFMTVANPDYLQPKSQHLEPSYRQYQDDCSHGQPLFGSFSRPSVSPILVSPNEIQSIQYDDLPRGSMEDDNWSKGSGSKDRSWHSSNVESEDEAVSTELMSNCSQAQKAIEGHYYRTNTRAIVRTNRPSNSIGADDPRIQNMTAARKPVVVRSYVRHHSDQPIMFDGNEPDGKLLCAPADGDNDFLAPFNKLERENPR